MDGKKSAGDGGGMHVSSSNTLSTAVRSEGGDKSSRPHDKASRTATETTHGSINAVLPIQSYFVPQSVSSSAASVYQTHAAASAQPIVIELDADLPHKLNASTPVVTLPYSGTGFIYSAVSSSSEPSPRAVLPQHPTRHVPPPPHPYSSAVSHVPIAPAPYIAKSAPSEEIPSNQQRNDAAVKRPLSPNTKERIERNRQIALAKRSALSGAPPVPVIEKLQSECITSSSLPSKLTTGGGFSFLSAKGNTLTVSSEAIFNASKQLNGGGVSYDNAYQPQQGKASNKRSID
jgi:hypothetical protein